MAEPHPKRNHPNSTIHNATIAVNHLAAQQQQPHTPRTPAERRAFMQQHVINRTYVGGENHPNNRPALAAR